MNILIAYASGYGATKEIAEKIGEILALQPTLSITLTPFEQVTDIDSFEAVILGSSVRADQPLVSIMDFLALYRQPLKQKKLSLFLVCLTANNSSGRDKVKNDYLSLIYDKYPEFNYIGSEAFGGKIDFDKLNPVMQMLMKRVLEKTGIPSQGSVDTRDWDFIAAWADQLKNRLLSD